MITFDDLATVSSTGIQTLAKYVQPGDWAVAFAGTSDTLRDHILDSFTSEFAVRVREEAAGASHPALGQVECTQDDIIDKLTALVATGHIASPFPLAQSPSSWHTDHVFEDDTRPTTKGNVRRAVDDLAHATQGLST